MIKVSVPWDKWLGLSASELQIPLWFFLIENDLFLEK